LGFIIFEYELELCWVVRVNLKDEKTREELLSIARRSLESIHSTHSEMIDPPLKEKFSERSGAFTTIKSEGRLRGCIGFIEPIYPLWEAIWKSAQYAATDDPRFNPMTREEIAKAEIELTILGKLIPLPLNDRLQLSSVTIGKHGLVVRRGYQSGLLLPQVAVEMSLTKEEFLKETAIKAGVNPRYLSDGQTEIYYFEGEVIS
jgi:AmmeMemoRadiSam system protein A